MLQIITTNQSTKVYKGDSNIKWHSLSKFGTTIGNTTLTQLKLLHLTTIQEDEKVRITRSALQELIDQHFITIDEEQPISRKQQVNNQIQIQIRSAYKNTEKEQKKKFPTDSSSSESSFSSND